MTQLLWKGSKEMGAGVTKGRDGLCYIVVSFHPKGNVENEYTKNLPAFKDGDIEAEEEKFEKLVVARDNKSLTDSFEGNKLPGWESALDKSPVPQCIALNV